jgi:hypothetical protein
MANTLESYIFEVNKLESQSNYNMWKLKISFVFMLKDLWDIVEHQII